MSSSELHLALLSAGPRHGYDVKKEHDVWFPDGRPMAFGQVYATLGRLVRDGLAEVIETRSEGGPERTVYAITEAGRARLREWLQEPAPAAGTGAEDIVRKAVVALRTPALESVEEARQVLLRQRTAHLRRMRELRGTGAPDRDDVALGLARRHAVLHLDADLRWLEEAAHALRPESTSGSSAAMGGGTAAGFGTMQEGLR